MRLKDKVAIITGAASGIGATTAQQFAKEGAYVAVTDVEVELGKRWVETIKREGGEAQFFHLDVTVESDWKQVFEQVQSQWGRVDILVNNAGISLANTIEDCTYEEWKKVHEVNLDGVFLGTREAIRVMKEQRSGSIINLSSIEGIIAEPQLAAYNSSKGGVRLLTKSAALHCAKEGYGIRINSVHPGYLHTPMHERFSVEEIREIEARHPIGRLGEAIDVAYGIVYLASDEAKFVTGTELVIDGGYTAQ